MESWSDNKSDIILFKLFQITWYSLAFNYHLISLAKYGKNISVFYGIKWKIVILHKIL